MQWNRCGVTREVILTRSFAIKVPKLTYGWRLFLRGLLANMQERQFWTTRDHRLCPVVWSLPGGWLVVMMRAREMADAEWALFDAERFCGTPDDCEFEMIVPAEPKQDSFGWLDGRVVAVDYGS